METEIGKVTHFFDRIVVGMIEITAGELSKGEKIKITGHGIDLTFTVESMKKDKIDIDKAVIGDKIGIKVPEIIKAGCKVYKITED